MPQRRAKRLITVNFVAALDTGVYGIHMRVGNAEQSGLFRVPFDETQLTQISSDYEDNQFNPIGGKTPPAEWGTRLFHALFHGRLKELYETAVGQGCAIDLDLVFDPLDEEGYDTLRRCPWEWLADPVTGNFLCLEKTGGSVTRRLMLKRGAPTPPGFPTPPRILVVGASPEQLTALDLKGAVNGIQAAQNTTKVQLDIQKAANGSFEAMLTALKDAQAADKPFNVVHFIGHGGVVKGQGVLVFEGEGNRPHYVGAQECAHELASFPELSLVYLDACKTGAQEAKPLDSVASALVRRGFPNVLCMKNNIKDDHAIRLSAAFYAALAQGLPLEEAVTAARRAVVRIQTFNLCWSVPILFSRRIAPRFQSERAWHAFHRLWTFTGLALAYVTFTIYGKTQGWGLDLPLTEKGSYAAAIYGLLLGIPLFLWHLWLTIFYAQNHRNQPWYARLPPLFALEWNYAYKDARLFQAVSFLVVLVLPALGQIHFVNKMKNGSTFIHKLDDRKLTQPSPIGVRAQHFVWRPASYVFNPDNYFVFGASSFGEKDQVQFFPFYQPVAIVLLEVLVFWFYLRMLRAVFFTPRKNQTARGS
ncbi:CHAT domain-containing protein [Acanthopleuribacter pedis]|uniref:CHAT domain-containing protein n=1 Tax=Acanthopleuribacter pedis TaxID=442870 RepID=A0A8J7U6G5_9BACT|nr:CHAT domain-containing protein [Acanthopleuribacter pedis]MBO1321433.1 CHAT domain-containing protein [Acanthopleuribacter pedis]